MAATVGSGGKACGLDGPYERLPVARADEPGVTERRRHVCLEAEQGAEAGQGVDRPCPKE